MAATLMMVPLAKIKPCDGFNPRAEFGDEQMAELVASVKQHGIINGALARNLAQLSQLSSG